ncbi:MAG: hypothetical protein M0Z27_10565 [Thermaerobacter sp.]|nr:hypothetical protein [Thermaerobacter sp.]
MAKEITDESLTREAYRALLEQAELRRAMPRLLANVLDTDPETARKAIRSWASGDVPLAEIVQELTRAAGADPAGLPS